MAPEKLSGGLSKSWNKGSQMSICQYLLKEFASLNLVSEFVVDELLVDTVEIDDTVELVDTVEFVDTVELVDCKLRGF